MSIGASHERIATPSPPSPAAGARSFAKAAAHPAQDASRKATSFAAVIQGLGQEVKHGESLMRSALGAGRAGQEFGAADLIALQAGVYRYGEVVDLASRLVDRATSSVKTVLEGQ